MAKYVDRDINSRIKAICDDVFNGNLTQMAKASYISRTTLISIIGDQQSSPGYDVLRRIVEIPTVNINEVWLLTGEGGMLKNSSTGNMIDEEVETRPRIPLDAAAGALSVISSSISEYECERLPMITRFPDYDFTIMVKGDSMEPEFHSGDEIACRFIRESSFIQWGRPHVLDTYQGVVLKRIYNRKDAILCKSDNDSYDDFEIPKEDIYRIALVVGTIRLY